MFFWIECCAAVLAIAVGRACPSLGARWFDRAEQLLGRLARRRGLAVVCVGLAALALRALLLPILPIPQPAADDEYGYLLLADTFAHGRLTNPTHPMWVHFESFYIFWHPTYTAKFYPAQGLVMALGQRIMGHPFWGVWISVGLMCAAICWMLQGWLPPGWALVGGLLAVVRFGSFSYWANSYWGGAVTAAGGALVLGALPRIKRSPRARDGLLMGLGLAILAGSRPYEGLFVGLPVAAALAAWMFGKNRPALHLSAGRIVAPLMIVMVLAGCALAYYFWRTTGSPWVPPYLVEARTYNPVPYFPWPSLKPFPAYHHEIMSHFYHQTILRHYVESRSITGMLKIDFIALAWMCAFFLGPALALPVLAALATLPYGFSWRSISPNSRFLLLVSASSIAGSMLPTMYYPHYSAAITGVILALVLQAMRRLRDRPGRDGATGVFITRCVPSICMLMLALRIGVKPLHLPEPERWLAGSHPSWCTLGPTNPERATTLAELRQLPGRQLAIVHYGPRHEILFHEWVYNDADIDRAKVVLARDMGPSENQELIDYFKDRHIWLVEADEDPPRISPYPESPTSSAFVETRESASTPRSTYTPVDSRPGANRR